MAIHSKVSGAQKEVVDCKAKVGGVWKQGTSVYVKKDGVWKEIWVSNFIALNEYYEVIYSQSKDVHYDKLYYELKKLTFKNVHIVAYDGNGNVRGEYKGTIENVSSNTVSVYNSSNALVGYVTFNYYYTDQMIRYSFGMEGSKKMTLKIGAILPAT